MGVVWTLLTTESSLNVLVALSVIFFVAFQCRSLLVGQPKNGGKTSRVESEKKIETRKEFADKQVGDELDTIEGHDDVHSKGVKEIPYHAVHLSEEEMLKNSQFFYERMKARRSVRCFSSQAVPFKVIQNLIKTAGTAPSGANLQPWTFAVIASDQMKRRIREIVEAEEQLNYTRRMGAKWVLDVSHLNVNWNKPYLTEAPFVIAVLKQVYQIKDDGGRQPTYYNEMSTCIAVGLLLAAIQNAGLVTVTTTPLNAGGQIRALLQRPVNEKVILLLPVGYPADNVLVPDISRKSLEEIIKIY